MSFTVISSTENLPRYVAGKIAGGGGKDFSGLIVVVPTVRLGQHLRRELGELVGACLSPLVLTLTALMEHCREPTGPRPVSAIERLFLLRSILKEGNYRHLSAGMEGMIAEFYAELADAGHPPDRKQTFAALRCAFQENPFGSVSYAGYWDDFAGELEKVCLEYRRLLEKMGLGEPAWAAAAGPGREVTLPGNRLLVCGFADATPVQFAFLRRLAGSAEFIYQAEASAAFTPVVEFAARLGHDLKPCLPFSLPAELAAADASEVSRLSPEPAAKFRLYSLPSLVAEARQAKYEALKALSAGRSVLVVVPRKPEYASVFSAVFSVPLSSGFGGIPHSNALARICFDDPAVQLLQALLQLAVAGFSSFSLSSYLLTPGGLRLLEPDPDAAGRTGRLLFRFLSEQFLEGYHPMVKAFQGWLRSRESGVEGAMGWLGRLNALLRPYFTAGEGEFGIWAEETLGLFGRCSGLFPAGDLESVVRSRVTEALQGMARAASGNGLKGTLTEFQAFVRRHVFTAAAYTTPEPFCGVQLVHILEARAVPAEVVILCGMNEGDFPASLPSHLIEEPFVRERLGLISPERLEALEEMNFFSLIIPAQNVVLTRCARALREEEAESRFLTRLRLAGCDYSPPVPLGSYQGYLLWTYSRGKHSGELDKISNSVERGRPRGILPAALPRTLYLNGSRCEMLLNCPARYFLSLLGVEERPEGQERPDPRYEGSTLHAVTAALWPLLLQKKAGGDREWLRNALHDLTARMVPPISVLAGLRLMLACGGWERFVAPLSEMLSGWKPWKWEKGLEVRLRHRGREFRCSGRADLIGERPGGEKIVVDFKRKDFPSRAAVERLEAPQLPFYSFCLGVKKCPVSHLGYCSFLKKDKGKGYSEMEEGGLGRELWNAIRKAADEISREGGFRCRPDESYCRHCPYPGVCRVEEGTVKQNDE